MTNKTHQNYEKQKELYTLYAGQNGYQKALQDCRQRVQGAAEKGISPLGAPLVEFTQKKREISLVSSRAPSSFDLLQNPNISQGEIPRFSGKKRIEQDIEKLHKISPEEICNAFDRPALQHLYGGVVGVANGIDNFRQALKNPLTTTVRVLEGVITVAVHPIKTAQRVGDAWDRFQDLPSPAKTKAVCQFATEGKLFGSLVKTSVRALHPIPPATYVDRAMNALKMWREYPTNPRWEWNHFKERIEFEKQMICCAEIPSSQPKVLVILPRTGLVTSYLSSAFDKFLKYCDNGPFIVHRVSTLKELKAAVQLSAPISTLFISSHGSPNTLSLGRRTIAAEKVVQHLPKDAIIPGGRLILDICSGGKPLPQGALNIAEQMHRHLDGKVEVIAAKENINSISFEPFSRKFERFETKGARDITLTLPAAPK